MRLEILSGILKADWFFEAVVNVKPSLQIFLSFRREISHDNEQR